MKKKYVSRLGTLEHSINKGLSLVDVVDVVELVVVVTLVVVVAEKSIRRFRYLLQIIRRSVVYLLWMWSKMSMCSWLRWLWTSSLVFEGKGTPFTS